MTSEKPFPGLLALINESPAKPITWAELLDPMLPWLEPPPSMRTIALGRMGLLYNTYGGRCVFTPEWWGWVKPLVLNR